MVERAAHNRTGSSAKALLLTILGEFVLPNGAAAWTATIIRVLELLSVSEANARQAAARLADDGVLRPRRVGRSTRWELTEEGRRLLVSGAQRIYQLGDRGPQWDGRWLLALAPVPEEQRAKRAALRSRLAFEGFGFLAGGVAISPHTERLEQAEQILSGLGLVPEPLLFTATSVSGLPDAEIIGRAWDLGGLASSYEDFIERFATLDPSGGEEQFGALARLVHHWRRFPFEDPGIPAELLPQGWPGSRARDCFDGCRARWSDQAQEWFRSVDQG